VAIFVAQLTRHQKTFLKPNQAGFGVFGFIGFIAEK